MSISKREWILLILNQSPLDRIHIMKTLFLIWIRANKQLEDFFEFVPYHYGPCSFEVYTELDVLQTNGLVLQPPYRIPNWEKYYLTETGRNLAREASKKLPDRTSTLLKTVTAQVADLSFNELLKTVYAEAPEFAKHSLLRSRVK